MGFEIDFLPVGDGSKNGDAIAIRYGEPGAYKVLVYDGGTQAAGEALVEHVKQYYNTDYVDDVVNSHPDMDHASGLSVVLDELRVGKLWLHRPWNYSHIILDYFRDGRLTNNSLRDRLQNKMSASYNLELLATKKRIPVEEPFQGTTIGPFHVLSPNREWYVHDLIVDFEKTPEARVIKTTPTDSSTSLMKSLTEAVKKAVDWVGEHWDQEWLREGIETSAENESSVVLYAYMNDHKHGILLTGDAGIQALQRSIDYLASHGIKAADVLDFVQIPHHGGRHNVSTSVLDALIGPRLPSRPTAYSKTAFVSAGRESAYPRKMVSNAFRRRGVDVRVTNGWTIRHSRGMPSRGWGPAPEVEFSDQVEAW